MVQRKSEAFKWGVTEIEAAYAAYLQTKGEYYVSQEVVCLTCGNHGKSMGACCLLCKTDFVDLNGNRLPDKVAIVDFMLIRREPIQIHEIIGSYHDDPEQEAKDNWRKQRYKELGYIPKFLTNDYVLSIL